MCDWLTAQTHRTLDENSIKVKIESSILSLARQVARADVRAGARILGRSPQHQVFVF